MSERSVVRTRATRPGPGSYRLLAWLSRLGVAGITPLALALDLHERTVYSHLERLVRAGYVRRATGVDGAGGLAVLTRVGARECRAAGVRGVVSPRSTAPSSARHGRAVSWVAASAEVRGWQWLGPAELATAHWRIQRDDGARHRPDLGLIIGDGRVAVEVELHAKAPARLQAILRGYRGLLDRRAITGVSYVVDRPEVGELIKREARSALLGTDLGIGSLESVITGTRNRRAAGRERA